MQLLQSLKYINLPIVFLIQWSLGNPFFGERYNAKLAWFLCWEGKENGVESRPLCIFLTI